MRECDIDPDGDSRSQTNHAGRSSIVWKQQSQQNQTLGRWRARRPHACFSYQLLVFIPSLATMPLIRDGMRVVCRLSPMSNSIPDRHRKPKPRHYDMSVMLVVTTVSKHQRQKQASWWPAKHILGTLSISVTSIFRNSCLPVSYCF